uniref:Uncharacterized protein n=1 Tax=Arundo donax TaxID=35708 RepID=A0A0A9HW74_ARUDO
MQYIVLVRSFSLASFSIESINHLTRTYLFVYMDLT